MLNPVYVRSRITGGHYALKTERSSKPFENTLSYYLQLKLRPDDIIADIGAYVGEYALCALRRGAAKVLCYEPTPETFRILQMNRKPGMELINKAVVGDNTPYIDLYISKGIGVTNSIVKYDRKAGFITVPAISYEEAVKPATVVKIDVEGAEYYYPIIQPQLRGIILEFHPIVGRPWREWAEKIMTEIEGSGYGRILRPNFKSGWNLTGCWSK